MKRNDKWIVRDPQFFILLLNILYRAGFFCHHSPSSRETARFIRERFFVPGKDGTEMREKTLARYICENRLIDHLAIELIEKLSEKKNSRKNRK